jgi:trimeric autotransporter adhesin
MKKYLNLIAILMCTGLLAGCGESTDSTSSSSSSSTSESSSSSESESSSSVVFEGKSISISTFEIQNTFTQGTQFENADYADKNSQLVSYMNTQGSVQDSLVSAITATKVISTAYGDKTKCALTLGSGSYDGSIKFSFAKPVQKIEFTLVPYWNQYEDTWTNPGSPYIVTFNDSFSNISYGSSTMTNTEIALPGESDQNPLETSKSETFEGGVSTYTIASTSYAVNGGAGRIMIKSLTFTY